MGWTPRVTAATGAELLAAGPPMTAADAADERDEPAMADLALDLLERLLLCGKTLALAMVVPQLDRAAIGRARAARAVAGRSAGSAGLSRGGSGSGIRPRWRPRSPRSTPGGLAARRRAPARHLGGHGPAAGAGSSAAGRARPTGLKASNRSCSLAFAFTCHGTRPCIR